MFEDKPVWTLLGIPQSSIETVDLICPNCKHDTAWKRGDNWFNCCMCFSYVGNGADKRNAEARVFREKLSRRSPKLTSISQNELPSL